MDLMQQLHAIERIKRLKARYFRCVDTKDWDGLATVFAEEVVFDRTTGSSVRDPWSGDWQPPLPEQRRLCCGRDDVVDMIRTGVGHLHTLHHGHMPEIQVLSDTAASGIWAMTDTLRDQAGQMILTGAGHYHETYRRCGDGDWVIKTIRLERLWLTYGDGRRSEP